MISKIISKFRPCFLYTFCYEHRLRSAKTTPTPQPTTSSTTTSSTTKTAAKQSKKKFRQRIFYGASRCSDKIVWQMLQRCNVKQHEMLHHMLQKMLHHMLHKMFHHINRDVGCQGVIAQW